MLDVVVIADDLTGAADTGIQFGRVAGPVHLSRHDGVRSAASRGGRGTLTVYTGTRHETGERARSLLAEVSLSVAALSPRLIYKKVDSCLRGNIGHEADALVEALGRRASFIAPAFPGQGRLTLRDIHYVRGLPVAESEMGRDPLCPVTESHLSSAIAAQSRFRVGRVDIDDLAEGEAHVADMVERLLADGCRHIVFDIANETHLDIVAALALTRLPGVVPVGSAGLAEALARNMAARIIPPKAGEDRSRLLPDPPRPKAVADGVLFVCGSATGRMAQQIDLLLDGSPCRQIALLPGLLADPAAEADRLEAMRLAAGILEESSLVLRIEPGKDHGYSAGQLLAGLTDITGRLLESVRPSLLFLSGGDTADEVLGKIRAEAVRLHSEVVPGYVWGTLVGGRLDGAPVVTKSGAFGEPESLLALYRIFRGKE